MNSAVHVPLAMSAEGLQSVFALAFVLFVFAGLTVMALRNRHNRPDLDPDHAAVILSQLKGFGASGTGVVVRSREKLESPEVREDIRALFTGEDLNQNQVTGAGSEVIREVRAELAERSPDTSPLARGLTVQVILTVVFGAIVGKSVTWWRNAAGGGGSAMDLGDVTALTASAAEFAVDVITLFPWIPETVAMVFALSVSGISVLWALWVVPSVILVLVRVLFGVLDRRVGEDIENLHGPSVRLWVLRVLVMFAIAWTVGAILASGLTMMFVPVALASAVIAAVIYRLNLFPVVRERVLDLVFRAGIRRAVVILVGAVLAVIAISAAPERIREPAGYLAGWTVIGGFATYWANQAGQRWRTVGEVHGRIPLLHALSRSLAVFTALMFLPLTAGYVIQAVISGKLVQVAGAIATAPAGTVLAVGFALAALAFAVLFMYLDLFRRVRRAIRRAFAVQAVRTAAITRGVPWIVVVVTAALLASFGAGVLVVIAGAVTAGILAMFAVRVFNRLTFHHVSRGDSDSSANRVVIHGRVIQDQDGEDVYIASVSGKRLAHRNLDPLLEQIHRDARDLFNRGERDSGSFARYYYREGVRRGIVDIQRVKSGLVGDISTRLEANIQKTDADPDDILETLYENYPDVAVDAVVNDKKRRGVLTRREDTFILRR